MITLPQATDDEEDDEADDDNDEDDQAIPIDDPSMSQDQNADTESEIKEEL